MIDKPLFVSIIALFIISLIMTYSLSTFTILYDDYGEFHFLIRQFFAILFGIFMMVSISRLDPDKWFNIIGFMIFVISFVAILTMPFLPQSLVKSILGAKRWINIGFLSISPVEFFKIGFIFFISWSFSRKLLRHGKLSLSDEVKVVSPYFFIFAIAVVFIAIFQKDLGQIFVLAITLMILLIFAGRSLKLSLIILVVWLFAFIGLVLVAPHRMIRIKMWWSTVQNNILKYFPDSLVSELKVHISSEPYQISNALNAIHHGGLFGVGLGNGQYKLGYLSEVHTDFILAGIAEEFGVFGLLVVSILMAIIVFRIFRIASEVRNPMYHFFVIGVGLLIALTFLVNSYGISGIIPTKGIAVPFLSYGGSHIVATSIGIGMILMISKVRDRRG